MFTDICSVCEKFEFCDKARIFLTSHGLKVQSEVKFQMQGMFELYDWGLVERAFYLLHRLRRYLGFRYVFKTNNVNVYMRKKDVGSKVDDFVFNTETKFFEYIKPELLVSS